VMNLKIKNIVFIFFLLFLPVLVSAQEAAEVPEPAQAEPQPAAIQETSQDPAALTEPSRLIFDDKMLLAGYAENLKEESKETLLAMIQDDTLEDHKAAAAMRVFKDNFSQEVFSREKSAIERILLRKLNRTDSIFMQIEIMHTLCRMDRYKYFASMVPTLIQKLDHYNKTANEMTYEGLNDIIQGGHNRAREARIVFNTLRKTLFLTRRRLAGIKEPSEALKQKIKLLRWSIKVLGNQELKKLPKEVIGLL